jgi:hypothetical protein
MSADTAPAAMPGVEDVKTLILGRLYWTGDITKSESELVDATADAILALFAPILAEKEREIAELKGRLAVRMDYLVGLATTADRHVEAAAEARALAAEAALAAERERCDRAIRDCPSLDENGYICEKSAAIAAIRPQGRQSTP